MHSYKLIADFNKKDPKAVGEIWKLYHPFVYSCIRILSNESPDSADLASDTMLKLLHHERSFESLGKIRNFLFTSAKNITINYLNRPRIVESNAKEIGQYIHPMDEDRFIEAETIACLRTSIYNAIADLRPKTRKVFMCYYSLRLKNREIAEKLGITEKAVEKHKTIAYKKLRMKIKSSDRFISLIIFI